MSEELDKRLEFLLDVNVEEREHSERGLLSHLLGTRRLLLEWGARSALCDAGLFHSIYGTEGYQQATVPLSMRARVQELIGNEAECLAWFCVMRRETLGRQHRPARRPRCRASTYRGAAGAGRRAIRRSGESHVRQRTGAIPSHVADVAPGMPGLSPSFLPPGHDRRTPGIRRPFSSLVGVLRSFPCLTGERDPIRLGDDLRPSCLLLTIAEGVRPILPRPVRGLPSASTCRDSTTAPRKELGAGDSMTPLLEG
jgi:hypothetical protein